MRHAFGHHAEFSVATDILVLLASTVVIFAVTGLLFDPEQRFIRRQSPGGSRVDRDPSPR
jgi:hypothetical protein